MAERKGSSLDLAKVRQMEKARAEKLQQMDDLKQKIQDQTSVSLTPMESKFKADSSSMEAQFKESTVGLVTAEDFTRRRLELEQAKVDSEVQAEAAKAREIADKAAKRKRDLLMLSFDADDDDWSAPVKLKKGKKEAAEARPVQLAKLTKDPSADTSFLPDRDRDAEAASARAALGSEWEAAQAAVKLEQIEVVYSYWDGAGHRRSTRVQKGHTIEEFLGAVLAELAPDFRELRSLDASALMYVKEDVILPPHLSFYELILQQARGKSGPLFSFGVQEDVRLLSDARIERDETHAGKVLTRAWYERNKHVFPASRWEPYDPKKTYGKYTVG